MGARYRGELTGTFGDLATLSFYPAHQITTGEGGCVLTNRGALGKVVESLRDWGRDCWCAPGVENTCGKRFEWCLGDLPCGYDHKYIYSHIGYNLKMTDSQAAVGLAQLDRLDGFVAASTQLAAPRDGLGDLEHVFVMPRRSTRPELVRVRALGATRCLRSGRGRDQFLEATDRDPAAVRWQPDPSTRVRREYRVVGDLATTDWSPDDLLGRRLPRAHRCDARLRAGVVPQVVGAWS